MALKDLQSRTELVIRRADKGEGIVVQNRDQYLKEAFRQLSNVETYKVLVEDPTNQLQKQI